MLGIILWITDISIDYFFINRIDIEVFKSVIDIRDLVSLIMIMVFCLIAGRVALYFVVRYFETIELYKKSEIKYRNIFENFEDIYSEVSLDGNVKIISPSVEAILGYTVKEMKAKNFKEFYFHPNDREVMVDTLLRSGEIKNYEVSMRDKKGCIIDLLLNAKVGMDENGEKQIINVARDITKYKEANRKRMESEEKYRLLYEKMMNGFFIMEPVYGDNGEIIDMRYMDANPGYEKQTRYKIYDLLGRTWSDMTQLDKEKFKGLLALYIGILKIGEPVQYEIHSTGDDEYYLVNAFKIKDSQIGVMLQNITSLKKALFEIQKLNKELEDRVTERTNDLKSALDELEAFTYTVSHDLKSPLRIIDGYSRIIMEDYGETLNGEICEMIKNIKGTSRDMLKLIDKLLEYSITTRLDLNPDNINMEELFISSFDELKMSMPNRNIDLNVETNLPSVIADRVLIKHVIFDILSNAFKFTAVRKKALITIGCKTLSDEHQFYIKDNGVGIDMEYSGKLFGIFQRLHTSDEYEGSGVGLASIKKIIQKHGGRTWIEGKINEGAVIYFTLPR